MTENSEKPKEKEKSKVSNNSEKSMEKKDENSRRNDIWLLFGGIPASVVLAMIIQYIYNNYYILPLEERTLLNFSNFGAIKRQWSVDRNHTTLQFCFDHKLNWNFEFPEGGFFDLLKGSENCGHLRAGDFDLKYSLREEYWKVECSAASTATKNIEMLLKTSSELMSTDDGFNGSDPILGNFSVSVSNMDVLRTIEGNTIKFVLKPGDILQLHLEVNNKIITGTFDDNFNSSVAEFEQVFVNIFKLSEKGMPEFYQTMGRSALALVMSSTGSQELTFSAKGFHNSWFSMEKIPIRLFKNMERDATSQALAAIPLLDASGVEWVLVSFFNLVNVHGHMPSNMTSVLDYTSPPPLSLFYLMNLYIEKHGSNEVENLKGLYPNIEKIGLNLFESKEESFSGFLESPTASKVVSIERHCLLVLASRALKKLSNAYGTPENSQKFSDLNQKIDSFEFLVEQFYDRDSNRFRDYSVTHKDGKEVKTFVGKISLSPLLYKLIPADSELLKGIFQDLENPEVFWSTYGIRSEKGVSLPLNFHILQSLHFYSHQSSPNQDASHALYAKLRNTLIMYVARDFKRSGTFWETYSTENGEGQRNRDYVPAAVALHILAEVY